MHDDEIPPVPPERREHGDEWHREWVRAHVEMAPWDRIPQKHLIDRVLDEPARGWLRHHYAWIASTTHAPDGEPQDDGGIRWERMFRDHATMGAILVRVVLGTDGITIVTAYPVSPWRSRPHPK